MVFLHCNSFSCTVNLSHVLSLSASQVSLCTLKNISAPMNQAEVSAAMSSDKCCAGEDVTSVDGTEPRLKV